MIALTRTARARRWRWRMREIIDRRPGLRNVIQLDRYGGVASVRLGIRGRQCVPAGHGFPSRRQMLALVERDQSGMTRQSGIGARLRRLGIGLGGGLAIASLERNLRHHTESDRIAFGCLILGP